VYGSRTRRGAATAAERRREAILDATLDLIGVGGPEAITHRAVAAKAGMALGSLTYHFPSRQELVREAFRHFLRAGHEWLADVAVGRSIDSPADLVDLVVEIARREAAVPDFIRLDYELLLYCSGEPELASEYVVWQQGIQGALAPILEHLGAPRPVETARTVIDLLRGFEIERLTRPDAAPEDLGRRLQPVVAALTGRAQDAATGRAARERKSTLAGGEGRGGSRARGRRGARLRSRSR
jgi:DNA-binding transcriptional regulator YbjK